MMRILMTLVLLSTLALAACNRHDDSMAPADNGASNSNSGHGGY